jgi:F-type H+-transporting ATPase subunit epsilon
MSDTGFRLTVLTEEKAVIDETVNSIEVPGTEGYLGVLRNHAALVTALQPGTLTVTPLDRDPEVFAVSGGFIEINRNTATILADSLERPEEIDAGRAEEAAKRARERLEKKETGLDTARAEMALKRALNRMKLTRAHRRG